ncbi:thiamine diphosphokinase [candidate division GN15 bacterium]|nr:thiamine diphosphokinase [candidate division GN15 bacterium]
MKRAVLFLHGRYAKADVAFYKRLATGGFLIAVDGGYRFFKMSGLTPDLLVGDFDSLRRIPKKISPQTTVIEAEMRKDATDAEMAVDYCLENRFRQIDIVQPFYGEADHYIGNVMLLRLIGRRDRKSNRTTKARLVNPREEIHYLRDSKLTIREGRGRVVSVIPLSNRVVYSCRGTDYPARELVLRPGATIGLRNTITAGRARFAVEGEALLVYQTPSQGQTGG